MNWREQVAAVGSRRCLYGEAAVAIKRPSWYVNLGTRARTYLAAEVLLLMNLPECGQDRASAAQASINPQRSFAPAVTGVTKMDRGRMAGARSYGFDGRTQEYRYHDG